MPADAKAQLRRAARRRRDGIGPEQRRDASATIAAQLAALLGTARTVLAYAAIGSEVDVGAVGAERLLLPRVVGHHLEAALVDGPLRAGAFGIAEPTGPAVPATEIDAVLVPALAFDRRGHRLGYGRGYYDRFLAGLRPDALTIGVCFHVQLVEELPAEAHDHPVGLLVTERGAVGVTPS